MYSNETGVLFKVVKGLGNKRIRPILVVDPGVVCLPFQPNNQVNGGWLYVAGQLYSFHIDVVEYPMYVI